MQTEIYCEIGKCRAEESARHFPGGAVYDPAHYATLQFTALP